MSPRRRVPVRIAGVLGAVTQLLVGLMNTGMFPVALVAALAAVAGTRQVGRDPDAASIRPARFGPPGSARPAARTRRPTGWLRRLRRTSPRPPGRGGSP